MKNIITILTAAAAIVAVVDFLQRQKIAAEVSGSAGMSAGAAQSPRWWSASGSPDNVMAVNCDDCAGKSQWGKYGVLPPYPFQS